MRTAGIITEYNPLHFGHLYLLRALRQRLGPEGGIVCCMSGEFVQRGDLALLDRFARGEAAVKSGADLVLELPLPYAVQSAEGFARGGVETLMKTRVVDALAFGSEAGDANALRRCAAALDDPAFPPLLRQELSRGVPFPAARQAALARLLGPEEAALLRRPNDTLGVEYCRALRFLGGDLELFTLRRQGTGHDGAEADGHSAAAIRRLLDAGRREEALAAMAPEMAAIYRREEAAGRAPVFMETLSRAVLAQLRRMTPEDFDALDTGGEGAGRRLYHASRRAVTLREVLEAAGTKRYPRSRLRRMVLWAYLGIRAGEAPEAVPYLRVLAANGRGRALLARMRKTAAVPVLTRPAAVRRLSPEAQALFALEARGADLYALALPREGPGDGLWRHPPVMV